MQVGYGMRGGRGGGRGRGGNYDYGGQSQQQFMGSSAPTDTLCVRISEIRQPVTEDMMYRVFGSISTNPRRVQIVPSSNPNETVVMAQFSDSYATQRAMESLNNRNIFNDGNKMVMNYTTWEPAPVLPAPQVPVYGTPAAAYSGLPPPNNMMYQQMPPQPNVYVAPRPQPTLQVPPIQQPQMVPIPQPQMQQPRIGFEQLRGGGGVRGRGRGGLSALRGGSAAMGFDPMMMGYPPTGYPSMPPMMPMANNMMAAYMSPKALQNMPTVFLSVTVVPEKVALQSIFTLIEAFGGVVTIRRNHNKKEILTVKMASTAEADNVVQHMRKVPFEGGTVSAKRFPTYNERTPCTDDGDPVDPATVQYDFTTSRHRSPGQRSKCHPSNVLKVTGCAGYSEADVMTYFTSEYFFPDRIIKDDEGAFTVNMADTETAVALLVKCHNNVCGEERSNVLFIEGPKEENGNSNNNCENEEDNAEKNRME
ncbi:hypothetical protein DQ04_04201040 [Trypanosoma grayi]|uniref:hypothetical protein n=1 Tax=Trypanosoma grayi TaxID=71804 RepID=UPI0004F4AD91|nr:hypothetical protein DQ04_04201040 [Trypanosoma grayi]KEG10087.1 hypothetical protein DQ04_04201040 [Trypanosoma grayi]